MFVLIKDFLAARKQKLTNKSFTRIYWHADTQLKSTSQQTYLIFAFIPHLDKLLRKTTHNTVINKPHNNYISLYTNCNYNLHVIVRAIVTKMFSFLSRLLYTIYYWIAERLHQRKWKVLGFGGHKAKEN